MELYSCVVEHIYTHDKISSGHLEEALSFSLFRPVGTDVPDDHNVVLGVHKNDTLLKADSSHLQYRFCAKQKPLPRTKVLVTNCIPQIRVTPREREL